MKEKALKEARRIRDELKQVETIVSHSERDWERFVLTGMGPTSAAEIERTQTIVERRKEIALPSPRYGKKKDDDARPAARMCLFSIVNSGGLTPIFRLSSEETYNNGD